jgi:hypothetical protein
MKKAQPPTSCIGNSGYNAESMVCASIKVSASFVYVKIYQVAIFG